MRRQMENQRKKFVQFSISAVFISLQSSMIQAENAVEMEVVGKMD
jgi:hypothetical protein